MRVHPAAATFAAVLALTCASARAQLAPAPPTQSPAAQAAIDTRIAGLADRLAITPDQQPAWLRFAQAMRADAAGTNDLLTQRAALVHQMTAPQNMRSYALIARLYADNATKLADAFDALYATLTPPQRQSADTLFRHVSQPAPGQSRLSAAAP